MKEINESSVPATTQNIFRKTSLFNVRHKIMNRNKIILIFSL